ACAKAIAVAQQSTEFTEVRDEGSFLTACAKAIKTATLHISVATPNELYNCFLGGLKNIRTKQLTSSNHYPF
ncbi:hypothetical protein ACFLT1_03510, partial [Bacteroidota bacterium]